MAFLLLHNYTDFIGNLIDNLIIKVILYSLFILSNSVIIIITAKNLKYYIPLVILLLESIIIIGCLVYNNVKINLDIILYIFTIVFISSYIILFFCPKFYYAEYILDYEIITKKNNCSEKLVIIQGDSKTHIACRFLIKEINTNDKNTKNKCIKKLKKKSKNNENFKKDMLIIEKSKFVFIEPKDYYFESTHFDKVEVRERKDFEKEYTVEKRKSKQYEKMIYILKLEILSRSINKKTNSK